MQAGGQEDAFPAVLWLYWGRFCGVLCRDTVLRVVYFIFVFVGCFVGCWGSGPRFYRAVCGVMGGSWVYGAVLWGCLFLVVYEPFVGYVVDV